MPAMESQTNAPGVAHAASHRQRGGGHLMAEFSNTLQVEPEESDEGNEATRQRHDTYETPIQGEGAVKLWGAREWTESIVTQQFIKESKNELDIRLRDFLSEASASDRKMVEDSQKKVMKIMKDAQREHDKRYPVRDPESDRTLAERFKASCKDASEIAYQYSQLLDVMVGQAPEYVAAAYGAVKILLVVQINYQEMKQNVDNYMRQIKAKFDNINHLTAYMPMARLVTAIAEMYDYFYRFLAKAVSYYTRSKLKNSIKSFAKPWKKLEPLVISIEQTYNNIEKILLVHGHFIGQVNLGLNKANLAINKDLVLAAKETSNIIRQLRDMMEEMSVKMSKDSDVNQIADLLRQRLDEKSDNPALINLPPSENDASNADGSLDPAERLHPAEEDLDRKLRDIFVELREFDEASTQYERVIEELPEMRPHRSKRKNIWKTDKVMDWLESDKSQMLWIDGNNVLGRFQFNSLFTVPLLISGGHDHEDVVILRHFCGDPKLEKTNNYRTLVQSLLNQLFKKRRMTLTGKIASLTRDMASNVSDLWTLFVECIREINADCTFIIIDSIDHLRSDKSGDSRREGTFILEQLDNLVKDETIVAKILLTAHLSREPIASDEVQVALLMSQTPDYRSMPHSMSNTSHRAHPGVSLAPIHDEMALIPHKIIEIQEGRCTKIIFAQLTMIYPLKSTIYTWEEGHLRAFVVAELSGMEPRSFDTYTPLQIHAWSIDHNGKYFTKKYHDFAIPQFSGEKSIAALKYIPAGYLPDERSYRAKLIARGRKYWTLGDSVHYQLFTGEKEEPQRVMIDQRKRPAEPRPSQEFDDQLPVIHVSNLKPLTLMICPPQITAFILQDVWWKLVDVDGLEHMTFSDDLFNSLMLPIGHKEALHAMVISRLKHPPDRVEHGKERGQVVLLHGVTGVGKTTTAICVADLMKKPLLPITTAQLSESSDNIEYRLDNSFQLARRWEAILLWENADIYLASRPSSDPTRNSIATTAMRFLETHTGIVFLTTNCVSAFDDTFISRINQSLYYPTLPRDHQLSIFQHLLQAANVEDVPEIMDYLRRVLKDSKEGAMNGREIRNAVAYAQDLAYYEGVKLWVQHFMAVFRTKGQLRSDREAEVQLERKREGELNLFRRR